MVRDGIGMEWRVRVISPNLRLHLRRTLHADVVERADGTDGEGEDEDADRHDAHREPELGRCDGQATVGHAGH